MCSCYAGVSLSSQIGHSLLTLVESTPISVDEVQQCVVSRLVSVIRLTVAVLSHHIAEAGPRADVAYTFVDIIHIVCIVVGFLTAFS